MKRLLPQLVRPRAPALPSSRAPFICASCLLSSHRRTFTTTNTPIETTTSSTSIRSATPQPKSRLRAPTAPTAPPPARGYAALPSRRLISVAGADAPKFLQGLLTASVYSASPTLTPRHRDEAPRTEGFYAAFLTAKGRVLHDVFVYPNPRHRGIAASPTSSSSSSSTATTSVTDAGLALPGCAFLVEVDALQAEGLLRLMRRYCLRSQVKFRLLDREEGRVWAVWGDGTADSSSSSSGLLNGLADQEDIYVARDGRAPDMGYRVVTTAAGVSPTVDGAEFCDEASYAVRRYLRGVPEGSQEMFSSETLPLEANVDIMGGIDFRKGCYVGQELTIRTKHRGVVRKRVLPCVVYGADEPAPQTLEYKPATGDVLAASDVPPQTAIGREGKKGRSAGSWIAGVGSIGLAMCRLPIMTDVELPGEPSSGPFDATVEFSMKWDGEEGEGQGGNVKVKAFVPEWIREKLTEGHTSQGS